MNEKKNKIKQNGVDFSCFICSVNTSLCLLPFLDTTSSAGGHDNDDDDDDDDDDDNNDDDDNDDNDDENNNNNNNNNDNTIQYKHEYYYSGINPLEFRGHSKRLINKTIVKN